MRRHFCCHKSTSARSMNLSTGTDSAVRHAPYVFMILSLLMLVSAWLSFATMWDGIKQARSLNVLKVSSVKRLLKSDITQSSSGKKRRVCSTQLDWLLAHLLCFSVVPSCVELQLEHSDPAWPQMPTEKPRQSNYNENVASWSPQVHPWQ